MRISIVIPARNEQLGLAPLLPRLRTLYPDAELIVVNDGSEDDTAAVARGAGATVVSHPYPKGNGAAIKSGARAATGDVLVFMDGDGQHDPADIASLLTPVAQGYDMVVGARSGRSSQASMARWSANTLYNRLASWMVNRRIDDLTSGFRAVNRRKFLSFLYLLLNGFSYPTTSTMAFFRAGYSVGFVPISVEQRVGKSHISPLRDGVRFFLIIFKIGTLYSPLKVYFPLSVLLAGLGLANHLLGAFGSGLLRFSNMSSLLLLAGLVVFFIGLIAEQLTNLQYKDIDHDLD